jgi:DNA polymerase III subunit delta'
VALSAESALNLLQAADQRERLSHAILLTGPETAEKDRFVEQLFMLLNRVDSARLHPDFHRIEPESKSRRILVEQIRELEAALRLRSRSARVKFGLISEADRMMQQAANAFLKTLEEPPSGSLLILTTALPDALLDTVRSRCMLVRLRPAGSEPLGPAAVSLLETTAAIWKQEPATVAGALKIARHWQTLLAEARAAISSEHDEVLRTETATYKQTTDGRWLEDREARLSVATERRYIQARGQLLSALILFFGDAIRLQSSSAQLELGSLTPLASEFARSLTTPDALRRLAALEELADHLARNVQESLAIEVACVKAFGPGR